MPTNNTFTTVLEIAEDIIKKLPNPYKENISLTDVLQNIFMPDSAISELLDLCREALNSEKSPYPNSKIGIITSEFGRGVLGAYFVIDKKEDGYMHTIVINKINNECWIRFSRVKELCSAYLNHYPENIDSRHFDKDKDIFMSLDRAYIESREQLTNENISSDTFAIHLAIELMISPKNRNKMNELFERFDKKEIKMHDIARSLKMPEYYLHQYKNSGRYKRANEYYSRVKW